MRVARGEKEEILEVHNFWKLWHMYDSVFPT